MENKENINIDNKVLSVEQIDIKQHSFILLASKRCSGKTVLNINLIKSLLDKYEYDYVVLFSDTASFGTDYSFIDKALIFKTDEMEYKLKKILQIQEKNIKQKKNVNGLILLDDVKLHAKSKELINLASYGRHFHISVICSVQYPKQLISSSIRNNLDIVIFSDLGEVALRAIYESIHIPFNFKTFQKFVDENNHNYQFILYNGRIQDKKERLKIVKAKEYLNLKMN